MKYCIFVLAHKNNLVFDKVLSHLAKYTTPKVPKYVILNNASLEVMATASRYKKEFMMYYYNGINSAGTAIDNFISENSYDFYFKVDDDVIVATPQWDKRLLITFRNRSQATGFISGMLPINCFNWTHCIRELRLEQEFHAAFPYTLDVDESSGEVYKENFFFIKNLHQNYIDKASFSFENEQDKYKSFSSVYYKTPLWFDKDLTLWLWKKVLELKLKPVNKVIECNQERYSISLIGFERKLWEAMKGFEKDDEFKINNYCKENGLPIIIDFSVIAHHFSYSTTFEFLKENLYPVIKDMEF